MDYKNYFENALAASRNVADITPETIVAVLNDVAEAAIAQSAHLLLENQKDLDRMDPSDPKYDRLKLTEAGIKDIVQEMKNEVTYQTRLGISFPKKQCLTVCIFQR